MIDNEWLKEKKDEVEELKRFNGEYGFYNLYLNQWDVKPNNTKEKNKMREYFKLNDKEEKIVTEFINTYQEYSLLILHKFHLNNSVVIVAYMNGFYFLFQIEFNTVETLYSSSFIELINNFMNMPKGIDISGTLLLLELLNIENKLSLNDQNYNNDLNSRRNLNKQ